MEKTSNTLERQVQEIVLDYFKNMDDKTVSDVVDSFVYHTPITDRKSKTSKIIEKFLKDNGLTKAYANYLSDYVDKESRYLMRSSLSDVDMIEKVRNGMLNLVFNRFRSLVKKRDTNFIFVKNTLLEVFERLNSNENYFYGEKDDAKIVAKIEQMK